jgi:transcriptional regulator with XRE-family HTH domain
MDALMPAKTFFAYKLRELREAAGLTQRELAAQAGINRVTLANLELGSPPSWPTVQALAEALGVTCEEFREPRSRKKK